MDEGILIEMAQRFRKMEDAVSEIVESYLGETDVEDYLEACREDMVAMQEEIRRLRS